MPMMREEKRRMTEAELSSIAQYQFGMAACTSQHGTHMARPDTPLIVNAGQG
jgi:hypothetical protein